MSSLYDSLVEAVRKLKNQIYILSAVFGILIVTAAALGRLTNEVLAGLLIVYVIALYATNYKNERRRELHSTATTTVEEKEIEKQGIKWQVFHPASLPNPLSVDLVERVYFPLQFNVTNETNENQRVTVWTGSLTNAVLFEHDVETTKWRFKYGIIPVRRRSKYWLDEVITSKISPSHQSEFKFHGIYVKLNAMDLALGYRDIPIRYRVMAVGEDEHTTIDTEPRRFEIPMERRKKDQEATK